MTTYHPIIGVTTNDRWEHSYRLREEYVDAVRRAGGIPVMLPPGEPHWAELLPRLDGIIFSGGVDVDPARYQGNSHHPTLSRFENARDETEIELTRQLVQSRLPMLYICRGIQVLNVALGGSLIEHLPDEVGDAVSHRLPPKDPTPHAITLAEDSRLAKIIGQTDVTTASWHHQAARDVAPGFTVVAHAPDGTIEALENPDIPHLVAVQWHPELTAATDPSQQALFDWLVQQAASYRQNGAGPR